MSLLHNKLSSKVLLALLTALVFLVPGAKAHAQPATRSFQMTLWGAATSVDTNIASFGDKDPQPPGRSVVTDFDITDPLSSTSRKYYDWSRITAVEVDEPYGPGSSIDDLIKNGDGTPVCAPAGLNDAIAPIDAKLALRAAELKALAPQVRFWVNFTGNEAYWMYTCTQLELANKAYQGTYAYQVFNRDYIDVVSADWYTTSHTFTDIQNFNSMIATYSAVTGQPYTGQQLALFPGVYSYPTSQLSLLPTYFAYANELNHSCNLPLRSRGETGSYDGCPVWIVIGWLAGYDTVNGVTYVGEQERGSEQIAQTWRAEVKTLTRGQIVAPLLPQWLNP